MTKPTIEERKTEYILSLSYGKDSLACLEAIRLLGYPLDRIITAEVWATETISADLPSMVEFKEKADKIIKERYGIVVEHTSAERERGGISPTKISSIQNLQGEKKLEESTDSPCNEGLGVIPNSKCKPSTLCKETYETMFYHIPKRRVKASAYEGMITGFPLVRGGWCKKLKVRALTKLAFLSAPKRKGSDTNVVQYLGIAADEPERIERHKGKPGIVLPLVDIGWDEAYCRKWCEENDLLSPIYTDSSRGGCWFCHNQGVDQLRLLRSRYPEYWQMLLKWDWDSPVKFRPNGTTVHDYDLRFTAEDLNLVPKDRKFRWKMLEDPKLYKGDY